MIIRAERVSISEVRLYFSFDQQVIDIIRTIPGRRWNKDLRCWIVAHSSLRLLSDTLVSLGHRVIVSGPSDQREYERTKREREARDNDWADQLLGRCSAELSEKVFKALTRVLHPDAGGDNTLMRDLNVARDRLLSENVRR